MRMLMIGPEEKERIKAMMALAAAKPVSLDEMKRMGAIREKASQAKDIPFAERKKYEKPPTVETVLPGGYHVSLNYEVQPLPLGLCKHISISVDRKGKLPHPEAIKMILGEFGMGFPGAACWLEEFEPGHEAVNVIDPEVRGGA